VCVCLCVLSRFISLFVCLFVCLVCTFERCRNNWRGGMLKPNQDTMVIRGGYKARFPYACVAESCLFGSSIRRCMGEDTAHKEGSSVAC
jgi:hypothetical protein